MPALFNLTVRDICRAHRGVTTGAKSEAALKNMNPMDRQINYRPPPDGKPVQLFHCFTDILSSTAWISCFACTDADGLLIELRRTRSKLGIDPKTAKFIYYITRHGVVCSSTTEDYEEAKWMYTCALLREVEEDDRKTDTRRYHGN